MIARNAIDLPGGVTIPPSLASQMPPPVIDSLREAINTRREALAGAFWGERGVRWLAIANQNDADFGVFTKKCFVKYRENGLLFCGFCIII